MNWDVFTQLSSLQIQVHWATAVLAFCTGLVIFSLPKGTATHKAIGWLYVTAMMVTATAAIFVRSSPAESNMTLFGFSPIHIFVPVTFVGIGGALMAIRRGDVAKHRSSMLGTFLGALLIAGAFTFLPGRHMHSFFFADPAEVQARVLAGESK